MKPLTDKEITTLECCESEDEWSFRLCAQVEANLLREKLGECQEAIAAVIRGAAKSGNLTANALRLCKKAIRYGEADLEGK